MNCLHRTLIIVVFLCVSSFALSGQSLSFSYTNEDGAKAQEAPRKVFPAAYELKFLEEIRTKEAARPYGVLGRAEQKALDALPQSDESLLLNNDILAFYGHPKSKNMGILGRHSKEELKEKLDELASEYKSAGKRDVIPAFYLIYGTVWPEGEIGTLKDAVVKEYVEYALQNNMLIFLDHQIGKYDPIASLEKMLPWLKYPNVHLALDPEWRTTSPMVEIGSVSAGEINKAQETMENYMIENGIGGERLLVIHQFNWVMIKNRDKVKADFDKVRLVHCADGFGAPAVKRSAYAYNAKADNIPVKAFKLFYNSGIKGHGYDHPLLKPEEVFALDPRPYLVMYQ
jgi:hypothetical protein